MSAADTAASAVYDGFFPLKTFQRIWGAAGGGDIYHGLCLPLWQKLIVQPLQFMMAFLLNTLRRVKRGKGVKITVCVFIWWQKLILQPKPKFNKSEGYGNRTEQNKVHACLDAQPCPTLCDPRDCRPPAPLSMGFPRQEYWSGLPFPPPGDIPDPGMESMSSALQVDSLPLSHAGNSQQDRTELINSLKGTGQLFTNLLLENTDRHKKNFQYNSFIYPLL